MKSKALWQRYELWLLICCIGLALAVRIFRIAPLMVFTYDQGRDFYVLQKISRGDITLIGPTTGLPGVFLGPFMYYFLLPGFVLTQGSPVGVLIWQMVLIVATFPFLYLILKPLIGKWWSGLALLWLTLTPGAIDQARIIWNPSLVVLTLLPSIYCLITSRQRPWLLPISFFLYGLSLQTELAYTFFLAPLYGIWLLLYFDLPTSWAKRLPAWIRPLQPHYSWQHIGLACGAFAATLLPQIVFELKNRFLITNSILTEMGDVSKQVSYQYVRSTRPSIIWKNLTGLFSGGASGGVLITGLAFISAFYNLVVNRRRPAAWFFSGYFLLPLIGFMFHRGNYGYFFDYYMSPHYLPAIAVIVLSLAHLTQASRRIAIGVALCLLLLIGHFYVHYARIIYQIPLFQYTTALEIQALLHARQIAKTESAALEVFVPNLVPVAYQYLSEWLSRTGQARPMDFGGDGRQEYILIYEPSIGDGSKVAFQEWYTGWKKDAVCDPATQFGIITVERCERAVTP